MRWDEFLNGLIMFNLKWLKINWNFDILDDAHKGQKNLALSANKGILVMDKMGCNYIFNGKISLKNIKYHEKTSWYIIEEIRLAENLIIIL